MVRLYRNTCCNAVIAEQIDVENETKFVYESDVKSALDDIENRVNEILSDLDGISGLIEIEEIKTKLKKLSEDLY